MIYEQIKELTLNSDKKVLSKALGYAREKNFSSTLADLQRANSLDEFISRGHFDWSHSSKTLILALSEHLGLISKMSSTPPKFVTTSERNLEAHIST